MEKAPLLTVIIPVYNSEKTVQNTALSVIEQPNSDMIQLLLIDDGSTDGSAAVLDTLANTYNNVSVYHRENGGVSSARNYGIENAQGKYLAFLDSDDWWSNGFFTDDLVAELSQNQSSDLYCFSYQKVSPNKKWVKPLRVKPGVHIYDEPALSHIVGQPHCAFFYLREYLNSYGFRYMPTKVWEDVPFSQMCCTFAKSITCMERIIFSYYMNYNSCMHTKSSVNKFMEHCRSEYLAAKIYESNGIVYDINRTIVSLIGECLKDISVENSYSFVKKLISGPEFNLLNHSSIQPWNYLQADVRLWRERPFLAYLKCKIKGVPKYIKRALHAFRFTRSLSDIIQYRFIEKWSNA